MSASDTSKNEKTFRLMDLPFVVFRRLMYQLEFFTVVDLTLLSKKCKRDIRSCVLNATDVELELTKNFATVLNVMFNGNKYSFGVIETVNADQQETLISTVDDSLFKPICSQVLWILHKKSVDTFRFERTITNADLTEHWNILENVSDVYVASEVVTSDEMALVAGKFERLKNLIIDPALPKDFKGLADRKLDSLYLEGTETITLPNFMNLRSKILLMESCNLEKCELNLFIKSWLNAPTTENNELTAIRIFRIDTDLTVLDGIKRSFWNPMLRSQDYVIQLKNGVMAIDCSIGYDIYRSDGVLATVRMKDFTSFDFFVWKERFPKVPELHFRM